MVTGLPAVKSVVVFIEQKDSSCSLTPQTRCEPCGSGVTSYKVIGLSRHHGTLISMRPRVFSQIRLGWLVFVTQGNFARAAQLPRRLLRNSQSSQSLPRGCPVARNTMFSAFCQTQRLTGFDGDFVVLHRAQTNRGLTHIIVIASRYTSGN